MHGDDSIVVARETSALDEVAVDKYAEKDLAYTAHEGVDILDTGAEDNADIATKA